ncbi:MAG TPA: hypothetical protein VLL08_19615 [Kineosporiaceae bacterium]|nr:hypothetical protein [Kineosporiaceae bacterium]
MRPTTGQRFSRPPRVDHPRPALDLAAAWVLLPAGTAAGFFAAYAEADEATVRRARGLAVLKSLILIADGPEHEENPDHGSDLGF